MQYKLVDGSGVVVVSSNSNFSSVTKKITYMFNRQCQRRGTLTLLVLLRTIMVQIKFSTTKNRTQNLADNIFFYIFSDSISCKWNRSFLKVNVFIAIKGKT